MAGRGPAPKDPNKRARTNSDPVALRTVQITAALQPSMVDLLGETSPLTGVQWHPATLTLWSQLGDHPATGNLVAAQWSSLARAVMYDDAATRGELAPAEARLRLAKFFIDPDDMLRGRITTVQADEAEEKRPAAPSSRARRGSLKALPDAK
jgi:hypothetical protein